MDRVASAAAWRNEFERLIAERDDPGPRDKGMDQIAAVIERLSGGSSLPLEKQRDIVLSQVSTSTEFWRFESDGSFSVYRSEADTDPDRGRWRVRGGRVAVSSGGDEWIDWFLWRDGRLECPFSMGEDSASAETVAYVHRR